MSDFYLIVPSSLRERAMERINSLCTTFDTSVWNVLEEGENGIRIRNTTRTSEQIAESLKHVGVTARIFSEKSVQEYNQQLGMIFDVPAQLNSPEKMGEIRKRLAKIGVESGNFTPDKMNGSLEVAVAVADKLLGSLGGDDRNFLRIEAESENSIRISGSSYSPKEIENAFSQVGVEAKYAGLAMDAMKESALDPQAALRRESDERRGRLPK